MSYLLYWWNAFARGYAFEVEIFQDLERAGIQFLAHNLLVQCQRSSAGLATPSPGPFPASKEGEYKLPPRCRGAGALWARVGLILIYHNLPDTALDRNQRFSPSDLIVMGQAGDIKTSTYFLYIAQVPTHDFYIVRFANQGRIYTVVVMLQPSAWEAINGDTVDGDLSSVLKQLPLPVRIYSNAYEFVIIEYNEWQQRVLRRQGKL